MKPQDPPPLERRRAADFERELLTRARTWIPSWSLDESESDFGVALLKIAARFNSEVAERLDRAGEKVARGFLDWLGLPALASRPARLPVVLKMAETAREPVLAQRPVKLQVDVAEATVTFETEKDLQVIPGQLAAVVAVDPDKDEYYLPPPGLTSLDPIAPLPTAWKLKNFVAPGSKTLQLDPGVGLLEDMLVQIGNAQYRIVKAKDDLVTIDPQIPAGDGFDEGTRVTKVEAFRPFDDARNLQEHVLYIGDSELLNVEAEARIEVNGLGPVPDDVEWQYWGKKGEDDPTDADPRWRPLTPDKNAARTGGALILNKSKGSVESRTVGAAEGRWIRARLITSGGLVQSDSVKLRINPRADDSKPPDELSKDPIDWSKVLRPEIFVNSTSSATSNLYLFGAEPRLFDTLYVGSAEAFSKPDAKAWIQFELSDGAFKAMTAFDRGSGAAVLAGVDKGGGLYLFSIGPDGTLTRLNARQSPRPAPEDASDPAGSSPSNFTLTSSGIRPAVWASGLLLYAAVAAKGDVWVRKEWTGTLAPIFGTAAGGAWEYWGNPGGDPVDEIRGMAVISEGGVPTLVAHTAAGLFKRSSNAGSAWLPMLLMGIPNQQIKLVAGIRSDNPAQPPAAFLVTRSKSNGSCELYTVTAAGAPSRVFDATVDVDPDVAPFGVSSTSITIVVAVSRNPRKLRAWRSDNADLDLDLGSATISETILDGTSQVASVTVYGRGEVDGRPALLAWSPFDPDVDHVLFATEIKGPAGAPVGTVAVIPGRAFLPGTRKGEILAASLSAWEAFKADATDFGSVLAVSATGPQPAVGDTIVVRLANALADAEIAAPEFEGLPGNAGLSFYRLDKTIKRDAAEDDIFVFGPASSSKTGNVETHDGTASEFTLETMLDRWTVILVRDGAGAGSSYQAVEITDIIDAAQKRVRVEPELIAPNGPVDYLAPSQARGRICPSLALANANSGWDPARVSDSGVYFPALDPYRQPVIAIRTAPPNTPELLVFDRSWVNGPPSTGQVKFAIDNVAPWATVRSAKTANATLAWEYWNGSGWWILNHVEDETSDMRMSGAVSFPVPRDIRPGEWAGKTNYWVRARIISGSYGEATVRLVPGTGGSQTVVRDTEDLQPPYAVNVGVAYALDKEVVPTFVQTQDSGTLRDQSDANRTPGATVEIFMPLSETLGRLDAPPAQAGKAERCVPDCECGTGDPSMSPGPRAESVQPSPEPTNATGAARRAFYLGFTSKLLGEPVNLLFDVARESDYDAIGPLQVEALIGDRFAPIVSSDDTRALGETGLLAMAFDEAPLKAELFGQALSWLRVAPRAAGGDWKPSVAGAYLNGVWTHAAETMSRELLGSSDGRPLLTVTLARPPLLQDSLELRVREPLGEEELKALTDTDPNLVKSDVTDLPGRWVLWKQVPDPLDCGARDRVYSLDEKAGRVSFGDGLHGMIPPTGVDGIVAFAYERTEPGTGSEIAANLVKPRTELNLVTPVESVETVFAAGWSAGGAAPESAQQVLQFAPAALRHGGRAISLRDFEELVLQKSPEVAQARAFRRNGRVRVVVVTRGASPSPSRAQQRELRRMLLEIAPPALGVRNALTIAGPRVRNLRVGLKLRVPSLDVAGEVAAEAKKRLVAKFASDSWPLGQTPREDHVAEALIDIPKLDGIVSVALFSIDAVGDARAWQDPVAPGALVLLAPEDIRVGFDVLEAAA